MATVLTGQREWKGRREDDGNYSLQVTHRVLCNPGEGPYAALMAEGLPQPGDRWRFNIDPHTGAAGEQLIWAYCGMGSDAEQQTGDGSPGWDNASYWDVSQTFSTKPPERKQPAGDPLLEPQKVTGSFSRTSKEALNDRFGIPITNSAWERFHGQQVEFDSGHAVVNVEQNVAELNLPALAAAYQTVNGLPLWGMPARTIKLSGVSWDPHDYTRTDPATGAPTPARYYTRKFEFEANWEGWDRNLLDEANKVLHGHWKYITTTTTTTTTTTQTATTTAAGATTVQASTTTTPPIISGSAQYPRGATVTFAGGQYVAIRNSPKQTLAMPGNPTYWTLLPSGPHDAGFYSPTTQYNLGDYVEAAVELAAGHVHVEKYDESDFVGGLGIPETL
jgi:hypothetical protein